ncbi:hypothetical protein U9M48_039821, partial [Paspalum notatum var. saurae]
RNENNEISRYKARLVAQGFTQRPGILDLIGSESEFENGTNGCCDGLSLWKLGYEHLYENTISVKLKKSLYGLKQSIRLGYNRLSDFLSKKGYTNSEDCPCVFIQRSQNGFCIISAYVDDLNIIGTHEEIEEASSYLKSEFEMKDLGKTKFCLGLQLEHFEGGILVHQSTYT